MVVLVRDQNQGTRNDDAPTQFARGAVTVLFHPDCDRRLRICTESADPRPTARSDEALAGLGLRRKTLTAGGDFHPALRTSAARPGGLSRLCRAAVPPASALRRRKSGGGPCAASTAATAPAVRIRIGAQITLVDTDARRPRRIRFRFVLAVDHSPMMSCGRIRVCLWKDSAFSCADSANHITLSTHAPGYLRDCTAGSDAPKWRGRVAALSTNT
jgi:hypothetical protein